MFKKAIKEINEFRLLIIFGLLCCGAWAYATYPTQAPEVSFASIQGKQIATADLHGKVVLVNFWATSCSTCIEEMPFLVDTYNKYKNQGYETIAVAMSYDPANYVLDFTQSRQLPFTVALDPTGSLADNFGSIQATPTSFLINRHGKIIKRYVGKAVHSDFHAAIESALKR